MRGADAAPRVAVEVLVEQHMIAEMRIMLQAWIVAEKGPAAARVAV